MSSDGVEYFSTHKNVLLSGLSFLDFIMNNSCFEYRLIFQQYFAKTEPLTHSRSSDLSQKYKYRNGTEGRIS